MSQRSIFIAGVFFTLLVAKPGFGVAILESMGNVTSAAFASPVPRIEAPTPQPIAREEVIIEEAAEKPDRFNELIAAITALVDRVDRIEQGMGKPAELPRSEKEVAYQKALDDQAVAERAAGYDGNDPTIRARLGLAPKVPPFTLFMANGEMDAQQFDRTFAERRGTPASTWGQH